MGPCGAGLYWAVDEALVVVVVVGCYRHDERGDAARKLAVNAVAIFWFRMYHRCW